VMLTSNRNDFCDKGTRKPHKDLRDDLAQAGIDFSVTWNGAAGPLGLLAGGK
jgi:hypothetical protein